MSSTTDESTTAVGGPNPLTTTTTTTTANAPDNTSNDIKKDPMNENVAISDSDGDDEDDELGVPSPGQKSRRKMTTDIFASAGGITLTWSHLTYKVQVEDEDENGKTIKKTKTILDNLSGCARPGRALAILGPSGGGKSSLTNACTGRLVRPENSDLDGCVYLNDTVMTADYKPVVSFVSQDDIVMPKETPVDAFRFSAGIRNENLTAEEIEVKTNDMLKDLKLENCKDTVMGVPGLIKGLSGGEKRRTNIGVELINNPPVIFLDEPTSGLDSVAAYRIGKLMRALAHKEGRTVVATIHSPSSELFALFDDVLLLAKGCVVYHGPAHGLREYFDCIGRPMPDNINPIEYAMKLLQSKAAELQTYIEAWKRCAEQAVPGVYARIHTQYIDSFEADNEKKEEEMKERQNPVTGSPETNVNVSAEAVDEFSAGDNLPPVKNPMDGGYLAKYKGEVAKCLAPPPEDIKESNEIVESLLKDRRPPSLVHQMSLVCARSWRNVVRDPMLTFARLGQTVIFAIFIGLVYLNLEVKSSGVQDRQGLLFLNSIQMVFLSMMPGLMAFPPELAVFLQDQANGLYGPIAFYWAKAVVELPINTIAPTLFVIITYFMAQLTQTAEAFFRHFCIILLLSYVANALGMFLGAFAGRKPEAAFVYAPLVVMPMAFVAGLFANTDRLEPGWYWLSYVSFMRYAFKALIRIEFLDMGFICSRATEGNLCRFPTGTSVVNFLGFDQEEFDKFGYSVLMLIIIQMAFRVAGMAGLYWQSISQHAELVFTRNHQRIAKLDNPSSSPAANNNNNTSSEKKE